MICCIESETRTLHPDSIVLVERRGVYHDGTPGDVMNQPDRDLTMLLNRDDARSSAELLGQVYDQLRRIAQVRMNEERGDHTLQATALVHEAYAKLLGDAELSWESRAHFFNAAAQAMRRILIDHARTKNAIKRGGDQKRVPISVVGSCGAAGPERDHGPRGSDADARV